MNWTLFLLSVITGVGPALLHAESWQAERNLHKRVEKGLEVAESQLDEARQIYRNENPYKAQTHLELSLDTAMEAYQMIVDSGEDMRKRAGRYKKIEIQLRGIYRKLQDHEAQVDILDRGPVERTRQTISNMQDALLESLFQGGTLAPVQKVD